MECDFAPRGVCARTPTGGPLSLLGPAAGPGGSLRRMSETMSQRASQRRRSRCEIGKLTSQPARWNAHNSTEVLELATRH